MDGPVRAVASTRRRGNAAFTVFLGVAMLAGAGVLSLVLVGSGAPTALAVGLVLAAVPVGPLIACYMWLDRYEPEPLALLGAALGWGALVATAAALVLQALGQLTLGARPTWSAAIVAPVTEEAAKGLFVVLLVVARRHVVAGVLDGIVYAGMVGIGFAFTENILYLAAAYMGEGVGTGGIAAATGTFVLRGIFSPFAHPFFTAATGIGIGFAVGARGGAARFLAPVLGYCVAVTMHALWNGAALLSGGRLFLLTYLFLMVPAFVLLVGFAVWVRWREGRMLTRALADCARRGLLGAAEVPWLARLSGRRAARRAARAYGGPAAAQAMVDYQQLAVELAFLHDRFLRGTAPADFAQRARALVGALAALRPFVRFPGPGQPLPSRPAAEGGW